MLRDYRAPEVCSGSCQSDRLDDATAPESPAPPSCRRRTGRPESCRERGTQQGRGDPSKTATALDRRHRFGYSSKEAAWPGTPSPPGRLFIPQVRAAIPHEASCVPQDRTTVPISSLLIPVSVVAVPHKRHSVPERSVFIPLWKAVIPLPRGISRIKRGSETLVRPPIGDIFLISGWPSPVFWLRWRHGSLINSA